MISGWSKTNKKRIRDSSPVPAPLLYDTNREKNGQKKVRQMHYSDKKFIFAHFL